MHKPPAAIVKDKFGDKAKLVAALTPFTENDSWLPRVNPKKGLSRISNAKLLRLHRLLSEVKEKFGSRGSLVDAVCELEKRAKDEGFKKRLLGYPVPRLYDLYRAAAKRGGVQKGAAVKGSETATSAAAEASVAGPKASPGEGKKAPPAKAKAGADVSAKATKKPASPAKPK